MVTGSPRKKISKDIPDITLTVDKSHGRLLVYFSSADAKSIQGASKFSTFDTDAIYLRDPGRGWYNLPISQLSQDADDLAGILSKMISGYRQDQVTFSGSSMGGYAAILFGCLLGVGRIVAVGPQIILDPKIQHSPTVPVKYNDLSRVIYNKPAETVVDIWFGADSALDLYNILHVQSSETVILHAIPGAMHNVLAAFKRRGTMDRFFEHVASATPFDVEEKPIPAQHVSLILSAFDLFFMQHEYERASSLLVPSADDISLSAVYHLIGLCFFKLSQWRKARIYFERAATVSPENYDANYYLGLTLEKLKVDHAAVAAFSRSMKYYPSPNGVRLSKLASALYRIGDYTRAIPTHLEVLGLDTRQTRSHFELGNMLYERGLLHEALVHYRLHAKAKPDFAPTRRAIAKIKAATKQPT